MKAYLQRAKEHDEFIHKKTQEYLIGKRHLANMMGLDSFTQKDVNAAIQYLFPSGIFDPRARPIMDEPEKIHPKKKAAEFDIEGRPFSSLVFYSAERLAEHPYLAHAKDLLMKFREIIKVQTEGIMITLLEYNDHLLLSKIAKENHQKKPLKFGVMELD
ncbi:28S ribosomal protein S9, mitochondrial-like [Aphidius gifuensis]|nr:28S ribosomal protein S9, mitochondrial-like [Aphidius gifuensis]XP_044019666.1 28S ribosomal protein S9, mitochondrial-like [Aphidius gifuensis]